MGFYDDCLLPYLVHFSMRQDVFAAYRRSLVPRARGLVLEIGMGSGLNLPFYTPAVKRVIGIEPSRRLLSMVRPTSTTYVVELIQGSAENVPLVNGCIDTVVSTWTFCTIPDVRGALEEMRRVLKPSGHLLFVEHGRSSEAGVCSWQNRLTPLWRRLAGGCHLNRPIRDLIEASGFRIETIDTAYMKGPKPWTFMYQGSACPA
jgi:ubiquinone/menaquinone biosynthesis C-methylase UbiE